MWASAVAVQHYEGIVFHPKSTRQQTRVRQLDNAGQHTRILGGANPLSRVPAICLLRTCRHASTAARPFKSVLRGLERSRTLANQVEGNQ